MTGKTKIFKTLYSKLFYFRLPPRIGRVRYCAKILQALITSGIFFIISVLMLLIFAICTSLKPFSVDLKDPLAYAFIAIVCTSILIFIVNLIILKIKRLHDVNSNGWWVLLSFIPGLGSLFDFILFIIRGNKIENKYGPPPEKATKLEWILAILSLPILITIWSIIKSLTK